MFKLRSIVSSAAFILLGTMLTSPKGIAETNNKPRQIGLGYSSGTTIIWNDTEQVIRKMWLDNPTFATIDIFGCVEGWNGCSTSNARIIHLKRNKDLKLEHIPYTDKTLLTVLTEDKTGEVEVHLFEVRKAGQTSQPTIQIGAKKKLKPMTVLPRQPESKFGMPPEKLAAEVDRAIKRARETNPLGLEVISDLKRFSNLLKLGTAEHNALALSGISEELVKQILKSS